MMDHSGVNFSIEDFHQACEGLFRVSIVEATITQATAPTIIEAINSFLGIKGVTIWNIDARPNFRRVVLSLLQPESLQYVEGNGIKVSFAPQYRPRNHTYQLEVQNKTSVSCHLSQQHRYASVIALYGSGHYRDEKGDIERTESSLYNLKEIIGDVRTLLVAFDLHVQLKRLTSIMTWLPSMDSVPQLDSWVAFLERNSLQRRLHQLKIASMEPAVADLFYPFLHVAEGIQSITIFSQSVDTILGRLAEDHGRDTCCLPFLISLKIEKYDGDGKSIISFLNARHQVSLQSASPVDRIEEVTLSTCPNISMQTRENIDIILSCRNLGTDIVKEEVVPKVET
ncbi:hypothetical protein FRC14_008132 [Serendipita sp. 396]|nr:hypothetical protein FRC14_008132 [Serendipita sp. 396]